jgi:hypothetical protein
MAADMEEAADTIEALHEALDEIAHASWPSFNGDDPVKRIQAFAIAAISSRRPDPTAQLQE